MVDIIGVEKMVPESSITVSVGLSDAYQLKVGGSAAPGILPATVRSTDPRPHISLSIVAVISGVIFNTMVISSV